MPWTVINFKFTFNFKRNGRRDLTALQGGALCVRSHFEYRDRQCNGHLVEETLTVELVS